MNIKVIKADGLLHIPNQQHSTIQPQARCGALGILEIRPVEWAGVWCTECIKTPFRLEPDLSNLRLTVTINTDAPDPPGMRLGDI